MAQSIPLETYISLEKEFGKAVAERITSLLEFSFAQSEKKVEQIATQKKLEIKYELSKELASKADLALLKSELKSESRLYFVILLSAIILLNKDSLMFIAHLLRLMK